MRTRDRDRTAPRAWNVLRAVAAATLLLSAVAQAADGPATTTAVKPAPPATRPAAHDSLHATAPATSPDEPPAPAPATPGKTLVKPATTTATAKPTVTTAAKPTTTTAAKPAAKPAAPVAAQSWHPPLAPPPTAAATGTRTAPAPTTTPAPVATAKPAAAPIAGARPTASAVAPFVQTPGAKPAPAPAPTPVTTTTTTTRAVTPVQPAPAPGVLIKLPMGGTATPAPAPAQARPATPSTPAAPAPTTTPAKMQPTTLPAPASGLAHGTAKPGVPGAATSVVPNAVPMSSSNPAFIGPPAPPALLAKNAAARPTGSGASGSAAVAASAQPMAVNLKPVAGPTLSHLDEHLSYQYNALGRRDPFQPLIGGGYVAADEGGNALPDVGGLKIVGIVWGTDDQFAMAEDSRGQSMVLRRGDKVINGVVESLRRDAVVVNLTVDGQSQSVVVPLTKKGDR